MPHVVEIIPGAVDLFPPDGHVSIGGIHVVLVAVAVSQPSGEHFPVLVEIIVFSVDLLPSGEHHTGAGIEVIPDSFDRCPAEGAAAVSLKIIPVVVDGTPSNYHGSVASDIIILAADVDPAVVDHGAIIGFLGIEVIIFSIHKFPAHSHLAVGFKIVVFPVYLFPSGSHVPGGQIHVVILIVCSVDPALVVGAVIVHINIAGAVQLP